MKKHDPGNYEKVHDTWLEVNLSYIALLLTFFTAIIAIKIESFTIRIFLLVVYIIFAINLFFSEKVRKKAHDRSEFGSLSEELVKSEFGFLHTISFILRRATSIMIFSLLIMMIIWTFENQCSLKILTNRFLILLFSKINFCLLIFLFLVIIIYCLIMNRGRKKFDSRKIPEN
ncbi:MAG: hypothetical protein ISS48_04095 [Candidatus Aenigmarchaeota archaeon]|nr:hypothetical protein [Candidatus Aenigmarchaeota archaeon]